MKINNSVLIGLMAALCVVLGVAESFIPMPVPGIRLGLANIPIMIMLYLSSFRSAFFLLILKCFLVPVFSGNFLFKLSLGLPSSVIAFIVIFIVIKLFRKYSSPVAAGVAGAFVHMSVQIFLAGHFYINWLLSANKLVGVMLVIATVTGILTGILTDLIVNHSIIGNLFMKKNEYSNIKAS